MGVRAPLRRMRSSRRPRDWGPVVAAALLTAVIGFAGVQLGLVAGGYLLVYALPGGLAVGLASDSFSRALTDAVIATIAALAAMFPLFVADDLVFVARHEGVRLATPGLGTAPSDLPSRVFLFVAVEGWFLLTVLLALALLGTLVGGLLGWWVRAAAVALR